VLSRYQTPEEQEIADKAYEQAADAVLEYLKNGISSAMNRYNTKKPKKEKPPKEDPPAGEEAAASEQAEEGKE
jgi:cytosine/adenosine deaminase-related metal-dependent hydrolase